MAAIDEERNAPPRRDEDILSSEILTRVSGKVASVHRFVVSLLVLIPLLIAFLVYFGRLWRLPDQLDTMNSTVIAHIAQQYTKDSLQIQTMLSLNRSSLGLEYRVCMVEQKGVEPNNCAKEVFLREERK